MKGFLGERSSFAGITTPGKQSSYGMAAPARQSSYGMAAPGKQSPHGMGAPGKQSSYGTAGPAKQNSHIMRRPGIHEPTEFERSGLDAEKLGFMDIGERRAVLIGAGLDPDKYDF